MTLPFSQDAFLDVFGAYNQTLWPIAAVLWLLTAVMAYRWMAGDAGSRGLFALLALHWAWSGIVYHWIFFRRINPAAVLFGALFVVQAGLFARLAARPSTALTVGRGARGLLGSALVIYGLLYPFLGMAAGLDYPRLPLFAVPCPTTLVTAGLLLTAGITSRSAALIPMLWAAIGSSAANLLGIWADTALAVAGAALLLDLVAPGALGRRVSW